MSREGIMDKERISHVFCYIMAALAILAAISVCCLLMVTDSDVSAVIEDGSCGENLEWSYDTTTMRLTITGTGEMENYSDSKKPPWKTRLNEMVYVDVGSGVTSIGKQAFHGSGSITTVNLSASVESINYRAFGRCVELTTVNLTNVKTIGDEAFATCEKLSDVDLANVTTLGEDSFVNCHALASVSLPSIDNLSKRAFYNCSKLSNLYIPNVTTIGDEALAHTKLTSVNFEKVTHIGTNSFYNCTRLTEVNLPKVTHIGTNSFYNCTRLTEVNLPKVTTVGTTPFNSCSKLETVIMPLATSIGGQTFAGNKNLTTVDLSSVGSIGDEVFKGCTKLETLYLSNVTSIGHSAFHSCSKLSSDNLDLSKVTRIQYHVFTFCSSLESLDLSSTTEIGYMAFRDCSSLQTVILSNCGTIHEKAFENCTSLSLIVFGNNLYSVYEDAFVSTQFKDYDGETPLEASALNLKGNSFSGTGSVLTKVGVKVTRNTNGGDPMSPLYGKAGKPIPDLGTPTRDGWAFEGWYSDPDCTAVFTLTVFPADDVTIYAKWSLITYTITFDTAGGSTIDPLILAPGAAVVKPEDPVREGYDFIGWDPSLPDVMPDHDITVVALWAFKPVIKDESTVEFDSQGDDVVIDLGSSSVADALADPAKTTVAVTGDGWGMSIPKEIITGASGQVSASAKTLDDAAKAAMPEAVKERIKGKTVFSLGLSDSNGPITFTGKKITVSLPYELPDGQNADNVKVFYIDGDAVVQVDARYDSEKKVAVFETEHFSDWFVDTVDSPSGNEFPFWIIPVIVAAVIVAAGGFFFIQHKKKA